WYATEIARGQRDAELDRKRADAMARPQIAGAWEYENGAAAKKLPELKGGTSPEAQEQALAEGDPAAIATGDPLNHLLYAVVAAVKANRPVDNTAVARLNAAVKAAQDRRTPVLKDLSFEDAVAARRFLNQLAGAAQVLRDPSAAGLLTTRWQTEGASVSDL